MKPNVLIFFSLLLFVLFFGYCLCQCVKKHKFHGLVGPPGGIFEKNNNLQNPEGRFWFARMALNHVLTVPEYSRHWELSESCINIFYLPMFDRFTAYRSSTKNFGPNVIYCFFGDHSFMFLNALLSLVEFQIVFDVFVLVFGVFEKEKT